MQIFEKTWTQFKNIISNNNMYWDYEDIDDVDKDGNSYVKERYIFTIRNSLIAYKCIISPIVDNPTQEDNPDQYDFDNNYKSKSGEKRFFHRTYIFTATAGETTSFFIKPQVYGSSEGLELFLYKGWIDIDNNVKFGDKVLVNIVDHDNVLGYGTDLHLGWLIMEHHLSDKRNAIEIEPPHHDYIMSKDKIPNWAWIKIDYVSTGTNNINFIMGLEGEY